LAELMNESAAPVSIPNNLMLPQVPSGPIQTETITEQNENRTNKKVESRQAISA
jgi:hypothetical protein